MKQKRHIQNFWTHKNLQVKFYYKNHIGQIAASSIKEDSNDKDYATQITYSLRPKKQVTLKFKICPKK